MFMFKLYNLNMIKILFYLFICLIVGCAHTWVVRKSENAGIIGYENYNNSEAAMKAVKEVIPCENYRIVEDREMSDITTTYMHGMVNVDSQRNIASDFESNYGYSSMPSDSTYIPKNVTKKWHEVTYTCEPKAK